MTGTDPLRLLDWIDFLELKGSRLITIKLRMVNIICLCLHFLSFLLKCELCGWQEQCGDGNTFTFKFPTANLGSFISVVTFQCILITTLEGFIMSQKKRIFQSDPRKSQVSVVNRPNMATKIKTRPLTDFEKRLYEVKLSFI